MKNLRVCELIWKRIRLLVEVHAGFLASIYEQHFDQMFDDVTEGVNIGTITRYKKEMLKTKMLSYIIERIQHKSLFS